MFHLFHSCLLMKSTIFVLNHYLKKICCEQYPLCVLERPLNQFLNQESLNRRLLTGNGNKKLNWAKEKELKKIECYPSSSLLPFLQSLPFSRSCSNISSCINTWQGFRETALIEMTCDHWDDWLNWLLWYFSRITGIRVQLIHYLESFSKHSIIYLAA